MHKVGIIGFGFVGRALAHGFGCVADIKIYDKYNNICDSIEDTVGQSEYIFVAVPTPVGENNEQDLSNIDDVVSLIVRLGNNRKTIIFKSTLIPGTTRNYAEKYSEHDFIFCPEFLTEQNYKLDFINTSRIIIGGDVHVREKVEQLYRTRFPHTPIFGTAWETAEVVKYMCNSFFAVKISFLNEMYDIAKNYLGTSYTELRDMWLSDFRIGNSHTEVPGPDGDRGYGGKCFPKDIKSFISWAERKNIDLDVCKAADKVNERVRKNKDWLNIKGAVSHNNYG